MAEHISSVTKPWRISFSQQDYAALHDHLFPGDGDEHGAVVLAGLAQNDREVRLLVREVHVAKDGQDFVPGKRGYRMLRAEFITEQILRARKEQLVYLAIHNHGGANGVAFSSVDLRSHERGYPALLDITRGHPVGALVFAQNAVAGDIWLSHHIRVPIESATIVGTTRRILRPRPVQVSYEVPCHFDRQVRLFGKRGQGILRTAKVAVIGVGGAGSILVELIARLGVGRIVLVDPDKAEPSNLPRLIGAKRSDAASWFVDPNRPKWIRKFGARLARQKVRMGQRNIKRASPETTVEMYPFDCCRDDVARRLKDCDYLFLAANSMRARLLFNALVHQFLIPGVQVGAKVLSNPATGHVNDVYSVMRPVPPDSGCLLCNGFINSAKLQDESVSEQECQRQRYVEEDDVIAPSVVTLNAVSTAHAANDFLFYMTGLTSEDATHDYLLVQPIKRQVGWDGPRKDPNCLHCGLSSKSCRARGDAAELPTADVS